MECYLRLLNDDDDDGGGGGDDDDDVLLKEVEVHILQGSGPRNLTYEEHRKLNSECLRQHAVKAKNENVERCKKKVSKEQLED